MITAKNEKRKVLIALMKISKNSLFDTVVIKPRDLKIYTRMLAKSTFSFWRKLED